ncbi:MAG: hypothetical protein GY861_14680 [bacterium]|nr:hypothetical protein [bacterium]
MFPHDYFGATYFPPDYFGPEVFSGGVPYTDRKKSITVTTEIEEPKELIKDIVTIDSPGFEYAPEVTINRELTEAQLSEKIEGKFKVDTDIMNMIIAIEVATS